VRFYCPGQFRLPFHFETKALLPQELSRNNF